MCFYSNTSTSCLIVWLIGQAKIAKNNQNNDKNAHPNVNSGHCRHADVNKSNHVHSALPPPSGHVWCYRRKNWTLAPSAGKHKPVQVYFNRSEVIRTKSCWKVVCSLLFWRGRCYSVKDNEQINNWRSQQIQTTKMKTIFVKAYLFQ